MNKQVVFFLSVIFLVIIVGGFFTAKRSFSTHAFTNEELPTILTHRTVKMSGVIKGLNLTNREAPQLTLEGVSGRERTVLLSKDTVLASKEEPLELDHLRVGDAIDVDAEFEAGEEVPTVRRLSLIAPASDTLEPPDLSADPEFESVP